MKTRHISSRAYTLNPNDKHLSVVLYINWKGEYVTHVYNSIDKGYHHGHYFGDDIAKATADFLAR